MVEHTQPPAVRRRGLSTAALLALGGAVVAPLGAIGTASAATPAALAVTSLTAPVYRVVSEGLTPDTADALARRAGIGNALLPDGSFAFVDTARFGVVPSVRAGTGQDEHGRVTTSEAIDVAALDRITTLPESVAREKAAGLLPVPAGYRVTATVGHTMVDRSDAKGSTVRSTALDTTVSYRLALAGLPVIGPGAKLRASFAGDGSVLQLTDAVRDVAPAGDVEIITSDQARAACAALYGPRVVQGTPVLGYYAPPLAAEKASGKGAVQLLTPHYVCRPGDVAPDESGLVGRLVPAAPALTPAVRFSATGDGRTVTASAGATGGTEPYSYRWSSSSTPLDGAGQQSRISYPIGGRAAKAGEHLTLTVTDANGVSATGGVQLDGGVGSASTTGVPGGSGGAFAETGIEQTVDEWQCAQDSANGFRSSMLSHGNAVNFDWRGPSAFEKDFKDTTLGGWDAISAGRYVDGVDAQWYTGHGNSGGFTFKSSTDDGSIVPADARWGDVDLEWLQLESCQVLKDTTGTHDYFGRWGGTFRGLHLLNGFDTNASCINGGTGGRFADYLFPATFLWWTTRPALTVQQAWATMADDLEPSGTRWRSISPATTGWVTNLNDHFWGQGTVGPDIAPGSASHPLIGWVAVSGVA